MAPAHKKKHAGILNGDLLVPPRVEGAGAGCTKDEVVIDLEEATKCQEKNDEACADLLLAMVDDTPAGNAAQKICQFCLFFMCSSSPDSLLEVGGPRVLGTVVDLPELFSVVMNCP